jgi:hypothetical protein
MMFSGSNEIPESGHFRFLRAACLSNYLILRLLVRKPPLILKMFYFQDVLRCSASLKRYFIVSY